MAAKLTIACNALESFKGVIVAQGHSHLTGSPADIVKYRKSKSTGIYCHLIDDDLAKWRI